MDPTRLVRALVAEGNRLGVRRVEDRIASLEIVQGRVLAARGHDRHPADHVVVAAGAWSGRISGLPRPLSVEPVRGQMLAVARPAGLPDVILYGRGHYLLTRGQEVWAGATMEHAGFAAETTEEGISRMFSISFLDKLGAGRFVAVVLPAFVSGFAHSSYTNQPLDEVVDACRLSL